MRVKRINPQRQRHRAQANAGLDESGDAAHQATFLLLGWLRSLRAWFRATRAARSTGFGGGGGTEPVRKCGGDTTLTVNRPVLSIDFVAGGIAPCMGALLRARPRGVALGMSFPRGRGVGKLIPQPQQFQKHCAYY